VAKHYATNSSKKRNVTRRRALTAAVVAAGAVAGGLIAAHQLSNTSDAASQQAESADNGGEAVTSDAPVLSPQEQLEGRVQEKLGQMTLEQKVAQLFAVRPEALTGVGQVVQAGDATKQALQQMPVGGVVYFAANLQDPDQTRTMLQNTQSFACEVEGLPLFLCVDEEGGTVSRVGGNSGFDISNVGDMCDVGAMGDTTNAYNVANHIASYLTPLGFNVDFAPDADIANTSSTTMAKRSFGSTSDVVAPMVESQVKGFLDGQILCCAKHFPGIGGAEGDSHSSSIYSQKTLDEMSAEELVPFQSAISAGVPFIMVGHLSCPQVTGNDDPASISPTIITGVLREQLGYEGIVITDSMGMGAVTDVVSSDQVAVRAIEAGADMVLMPADLQAAYQGVFDAVNSGEITEDRINESVARILRVKLGRMSEDGSVLSPSDAVVATSSASGTSE
jgi:beta-N-acetylhexosaminidase